MPSYLQLQAEPWWNAEYQPPTLATLCRSLRGFFDVGAGSIGSKGDNNHLYGYHRSAAWVRNSAYCTNRTYSVSETPGNRNPPDPNWLCAVDITIPADQLIPMCQRLDEAVRSGRLEKVTEWYGNDDGDNRVDGYDNVRNAVASSDDSHLWHAHLSFDRTRVAEDHADVLAILTGDDDVTAQQNWEFVYQNPPDFANPFGYNMAQITLGTNAAVYEALNILKGTVVPALARVEELLKQGGGGVDSMAIIAAVRGEGETTRAEVRDAVADLGEGGATAVRADAPTG